MRLTDRDYLIFKEIDRWKACSSRHIKFLAGFSGQRATDRRLKLLVDSDYIERKKFLYGVPSIYFITSKAKALINVSNRPEKVKIEQIIHDMTVIDIAIYFMLKNQLSFKHITTEKELHRMDGFGVRKHRPDFLYVQENKNNCVEVELSLKSKSRLENIIKDNFMKYDLQFWIVPRTQPRILQILTENKSVYTNIGIINLEEAIQYVKSYDLSELKNISQ